MNEYKIGAVEFTTGNGIASPYLIGVFGGEHSGKTRLALSGPDGVGCVVTEMKSYKTLCKVEEEMGRERVYKPKDPMALMANHRKLAGMKTDAERQKYYIELTKNIEDTTFALLEHKDVNLVMVDKFSHYCVWKEFAINGMGENFVKIEGKVRQRKAEVVQGIIDFLSSLSQYGKTVMLLCSVKPDFDVQDKDGKAMRNTWNCGSFYFLGSHTNIVVETVDNTFWDGKSTVASKKWHYRLNVRRCQDRPELEGPEGNPLLEDDMVNLPQLISAVEGEKFDAEKWL